MTKEQAEAIDRIKYNDIAKPLYCGDITICNIDDLKTILSMLEEKDKIIDLTIKELYKKAHISTRCCLQTSVKTCMKYKNCYECLKEYFYKKVEDKR